MHLHSISPSSTTGSSKNRSILNRCPFQLWCVIGQIGARISFQLPVSSRVGASHIPWRHSRADVSTLEAGATRQDRVGVL